MATRTIKLNKEKGTKNTIKFTEAPVEGKNPLVGSIYVQKEFAAKAKSITATVTLDE